MTILDVRRACGLVFLVSAGISTAGCGLISSDVTNFDLALPDKKFTIDTGSWQVDNNRPQVDCTAAPATACNTVAQQACAMDCSAVCNATTHTCDLSLDVSLAQPVNLVMERPELKSVDDEPVIKVTIDSVTYDVTNNTLSVDTPEITVYVAPISVTKVNRSDSTIRAIGTIDPVPAGQTLTGRAVKLTANGKLELTNIMSTFKTPFNILVGSSLLVTTAQPVPTGKLDAVVHVRGHAGI